MGDQTLLRKIIREMVSERWRRRVADMRGRGIYQGSSDLHRCIFIHIPKAAGTSVVRALFGTESWHYRYDVYEQSNPKKFKGYFKFTFVRNPYARVYSAYHFLKKGGLTEMDREWAIKNLADYPTFESFVKGWLTRENIWTYFHFHPQYYYVCDDDLNIKMDFVGRVENIDHDLLYAASRIGIECNMLHLNQSHSKLVLEDQPQEIIDTISHVYQEDFRLFNYDVVTYEAV